jgi:uncharacterized protein
MRSLPACLRTVLLAGIAGLVLSGCATFRSYDTELRQTLAMAAPGRMDAAIKTLDKHNKGDRKDLLYYLEMGELQRLATQYEQSQQAWLAADGRVQEWEAAAKLDPLRAGGSVASYILNDKLRAYEGQDFEKVMLTTRMALNFLARGDFDNARVAIKQTHEREALIAEVRAKQYAQVEDEARKRGADTSYRDLNGYPVSTLDTPEVRALRNSYQSAYSHYLAGFVYEALGEASLAAAGYRQAIELRGSDGFLDEALGGLDQRVAERDDGRTDVLFAIETGLVPARVSQQFSLPIPVSGRIVLISVSFPVLQGQAPGVPVYKVTLDGGEALPAAQITSIDAMTRRALEDEMPGIMLRGFVRSTGKAVAQYQAQRQAEMQRRQGDDGAGVALDVAAIALMIGSALTESADERGWRSLPASVYIARAKVPPGSYPVTVDTGAGQHTVRVNIGGRHAFVALRLMGGRLFAMLPPDGSADDPEPPARSQSTDALPPAPVTLSTTMEKPRS